MVKFHFKECEITLWLNNGKTQYLRKIVGYDNAYVNKNIYW